MSKTSHISGRPILLSIAGFDPCSGAGVSADVKTAEQTGSYALGVNTAITIQHESKFTDVSWVSKEFIIDQIHILIEKYSFDYIKVGLIENIEWIELFSTICPNARIVWDPILKASAGFDFHSDASKKIVEKMASLCYLITPNLEEWDNIGPIIEGKTNILLKGGHASEHANDVIILKDKTKEVIYGKRMDVTEKHGSGCILSTAITSYLSQGFTLKEACEQAKTYITTFLQSADGLLGIHNI